MRARLDEVQGLARRALDDLHRVIFDLRPSILDDLGLLAAVRWYAARHLEPLGITVKCEFEDVESRVPDDVATAVFRIVQEALLNVARHATAENVLVQIAADEKSLLIEIEDDGRGFDPKSVVEPSETGRGLGLLGMRERVEILGGKMSLDSAPGEGPTWRSDRLEIAELVAARDLQEERERLRHLSAAANAAASTPRKIVAWVRSGRGVVRRREPARRPGADERLEPCRGLRDLADIRAGQVEGARSLVEGRKAGRCRVHQGAGVPPEARVERHVMVEELRLEEESLHHEEPGQRLADDGPLVGGAVAGVDGRYQLARPGSCGRLPSRRPAGRWRCRRRRAWGR